MGSLWLKIKVWTKIIVFAVLTIVILVFVIQNVNKEVTLWFWNDIKTTLLKVLFFTALISVIFTILSGTTFRTIRQVREIRARSRAEKLEREVADMRLKASMLQTKSAAAGDLNEISAIKPASPEEPSDRDSV